MKKIIDSICKNIKIVKEMDSVENESKFFDDVQPYVNIIITKAEALIDKLAIGYYNPDETGVISSITIVEKSGVPTNIIKDIVEKYKNNNKVLNLIYCLANEEYKEYINAKLVNQTSISNCESAIDELKTSNYSSREELIDQISVVFNFAKSIILAKDIDIDVNSYSI